LEARVGIEPTHKAFAEPCLTTWLPRRPDGSVRKLNQFGGGASANLMPRVLAGVFPMALAVTISWLGRACSICLRNGFVVRRLQIHGGYARVSLLALRQYLFRNRFPPN
jgi:hypothetical protein